MQSFGAMTGIDPVAVREIEQLIQLNAGNEMDISEEMLQQKAQGLASAKNLPFESNQVIIDDKEASIAEQKKSKVIFSVKKDQTNSHSAIRQGQRTKSVSHQNKSAFKGRSGSNAAFSSIETGN